MSVGEIMKISQHKEAGTLFKYIVFNVEDQKNWVKDKKIRGGREQGPPSAIPRWTRFGDCPSHEDLQKAFPGGTKECQRNKWPLVIKDVESVNLLKLRNLECIDKDCAKYK
eukprot:Tbor_TRINITY_DN5858_c5_g5::TRINITY_DN5858_c5_g5_i1::g.6803::m.6803